MNERQAVLELVRGAVAAIGRSRARIDDLNVYPVPDGDTGTNLALTAEAVLDVLEASTAEDRATLARETTRAALMGARGNSGVILSQIVRGIGESLAGEGGEPNGGPIDGPRVARALRAGSDAAYRAVRRQNVPYVVSPHGALDPYLRRRGRISSRSWGHPFWLLRGI